MSHRSGRPIPRFRPPLGSGRALVVVAAFAGVATVAGLVALWPRGQRTESLRELGIVSDVFDARAIAAEERPCAGTVPEDEIVCNAVTFELLQGPDEGDEISLELPVTDVGIRLSEGDEVVLSYNPESGPGFEYQFSDRQRKAPLLWLALLFAVSVVVLGRLRGLAALVGLAASFTVILWFVLPAILEGRDPLLVALIGSAAIAFLAIYLAHGATVKATVALLGTLGSLALTAILGQVFVGFTRLSGFATEESTIVTIGSAQVDIAGLVLAGVVIGALGAIDDMTVTQASAVWELRETDPEMNERKLLRSGLRIGRDHVASTVNTLVLAYAGASLPLLILFVLSQQSLASVANGEVVATEIVRTLVGSIGLVASVPLTTWLAVRTAAGPAPAVPDEAV